MWLLMSGRLRRWLLLAVGLPVLAALLRSLGERLEARDGPTTVSRWLGRAGRWLGHLTRWSPGRSRRARQLTA